MAVSRRMFLRYSVATAIACAPGAAIASGRSLPSDTGRPNRSGGSKSKDPDVASHVPPIVEQRYGRIANITRDSFQSAVGSAFRVSSTSGKSRPFWLRLLSVRDLDAPLAGNPANMAVSPPPSARQAVHATMFSLRFSGGPLRNVEQETFFFQHEELGQFALFIVPAGPQQYTAIINRLAVKTAVGI